MNELKREWDDWLDTRPECVQKLVKEFPPNTEIMLEDDKYYLVGYLEDDTLIISKHSPKYEYDLATDDNNREYICAEHLREKIAGRPTFTYKFGGKNDGEQ